MGSANIRVKLFRYLLYLTLSALLLAGDGVRADELSASQQASISRVTTMPRIPNPYVLRDWNQISLDYIDFLFDNSKKGKYLPLIKLDPQNPAGFDMPAYVGSADGPESINYFGALVSASLVGLDMRSYHGVNWIDLCKRFYSPKDGIFLDRVGGASGGDFWYDVFPNVLYFEMNSFYPKDEERDLMMTSIAEKWNQVCQAAGARKNPLKLPDFDVAGVDLRKLQLNHGASAEPEGAAGIAWLEYLTWIKTKKQSELDAADLCLQALQGRSESDDPLYEVLLPYSAITAARMNAELSTHYDVGRLLEWCFNVSHQPQIRFGWGVIADHWGGVDVDGLVGSSTDGGGYAFAMNTFNYVSVLAPLARYDSRYAHDIGKWLLNAASAARLFYANAQADDHQSSSEWARNYDPESVIAYEGLRKCKRGSSLASADYCTRAGKIVAGNYISTHFYREEPPDEEVLQETPQGDTLHLEHIWTIPLPSARDRVLVFAAEGRNLGHHGNSFSISYSNNPQGPYQPAFNISTHTSSETENKPQVLLLPDQLTGTLYLKAESTDHSTHPQGADQLCVDAISVSYTSNIAPFAQGDQVVSFIDLIKDATMPVVLYRPSTVITDLALYGSSYVGMLGGIVRPTNVTGILQWDLLKTDYFHGNAYPTYLYYNPYLSPKTVAIEVGDQAKDIYNVCSKEFVFHNVKNEISFTMSPDSAAVIVIAPSGGVTSYDGKKLLMNGAIIDYSRL